MDYKEQIKNPLWQRRRLEILNRDNFTCQICGCKDKTLHVHHTAYIKGKMIWEYPDRMLITMCEDCHKEEHRLGFENVNTLNELRKQGITNHEISLLLCSTLDIALTGFQFQFEHLSDFLLSISDTGYNYLPYLAQRREDCANNNHGNSNLKEDNVI